MPILGIVGPFNFSHVSKAVVVYCGVFNLYFFQRLMMLSIFSYACLSSIYLLGEVSICFKISPFLLGFYFISELLGFFILDKKFLIIYNICKYFPICGFSFHSLLVSFKQQKFLILMKSKTSYKAILIKIVWHWCQDRQTNQWKTIESTEINPH